MTKFVPTAMLVFVALAASAQTPPPTAPAGAGAPASTSSDLAKSAQEIVKQARAGDTAGALVKVQAIAQNAAGNPRVLSLAGALYLQLDHPQEAFALLKPLADPSSAEPAILYNTARAALALGKNVEGREYLRRSAVLEPTSPAARDFGMMLAREGQVVEAYYLLRPWALRHASDGDVRLMVASLALTLERPIEAEEVLQGMGEDDPGLRLLRGKALVQKGDGAGALAMLQPLLASHPEGMDLEVRRALAEANLAAGNAAEAIRLLQGKSASHPTVALVLARAQHKAGDAAGAMATLKPLVDQLPSTPDQIGDPRPAAAVATEYASLLIEAGKGPDAMPILDKATRLNPRNPEAWRTLAKAYEAAGKKAEAQQATAKADELTKPPAPAGNPAAASSQPVGGAATAPQLSANIQEAMRLTAQGQMDKALVAVHREVVANPADQRARGLEVEGLLSLRRLDEALRSTEDAVKLDPQNPDYYYLRGAVRMAMKNLPQAESDLRRALQLAPEHTAAMSDLAVLLMETGKKTEARALLENVLKIYPNDSTAAANLAALDAEEKH